MTFDRAQLQTQILALKEKLAQRRGSPLNEENTKMSLIAPMIRALGWDTADPDEVDCEFRHRTKDLPVDYALMIDRTPCLLIEAKPVGHDIKDHRWTTQILTYAMQAGVQWAALTNGGEYRIYNSMANVPIEEKLFRELTLLTTPPAEIVETLSFLSKPELARRRIDRAWEIHNTDRLVRDGLTRLLAPESPSSKLVQMLVHGSKGRLQRKGVEASLRRAKIAIEIPPSPELEDGAPVRRREARADVAEPKPPPKNGGGARKGAASAGRPTLGDLIGSGALVAPLEILAETRKGRVTATIERDGAVSYAKKRFDSLSSAASAARAALQPGKWKKGGPATNGWIFWRAIDPKTGKVVTVEDLARR